MSKGQLFPQPNPGSAVSGPNVAVNGDIAQFDGTSGKAIKDGGLSLDTDVTMAANSDTRIPSQKASKAYADGKALATRLINTTAPLAGGGDLSADRTLTVAAATAAALGVVQPDGTVITVSAGAITVPNASATVKGVVKVDGTTITAAAGVISAVSSGGGATAGIYKFGPDVAPAVPATIDDEFDAALNFSTKWSWVNQGGASVAQSKSWLQLLGVAENANVVRGIVQTAPATPYTVACKLIQNQQVMNFMDCGLILRESATSKMMSIRMVWNAEEHIAVTNWTNSTTIGTNQFGDTLWKWGSYLYFAIKNDGTNLFFYISKDGSTYVQVYTELKTAHFTTAPDQVGLYANAGQATRAPFLSCDWIRQIA